MAVILVFLRPVTLELNLSYLPSVTHNITHNIINTNMNFFIPLDFFNFLIFLKQIKSKFFNYL